MAGKQPLSSGRDSLQQHSASTSKEDQKLGDSHLYDERILEGVEKETPSRPVSSQINEYET